MNMSYEDLKAADLRVISERYGCSYAWADGTGAYPLSYMIATNLAKADGLLSTSLITTIIAYLYLMAMGSSTDLPPGMQQKKMAAWFANASLPLLVAFLGLVVGITYFMLALMDIRYFVFPRYNLEVQTCRGSTSHLQWQVVTIHFTSQPTLVGSTISEGFCSWPS